LSIARRLELDAQQIRLLLSAFGSAYGVGLIALLALPVLVGATMSTLELNEAAVGLLYTGEFTGAALSSLLISPLTGSRNRRTMAFWGCLVAVLGNLASGLWCNYDMLLILRPLTGLGAGVALACGNATVTNAKDPSRMAGMMNFLFAALLVVLMVLLPAVNALWGLAAIYVTLALVMLLMSLSLLLMPQWAVGQLSVNTDSVDKGNPLLTVTGVATVTVFFLFALRDTMAWSFAERIGVSVGFTTAEVGTLLSVQGLIAVLGPLLAAVLGFRFGVKLPLLCGLVIAGSITFLVFYSSRYPDLYSTVILFWSAGYFFCLSYLTAFAASLDLSGRIVAASGSALVLGIAVGPAVSGNFISYGGYEMGAWVTLGLVLLMVALITIPLAKYKAMA